MSLLEENWKQIENRVIKPLWNGKFKTMFENAKLDYADFESLAGLEMAKAIKNYNVEKSNLMTFATKVISQKALTELRNCTKRDKRKVLHISESIDVPADVDSTRTVAELIPDNREKKEISELSELRVGHFINSLDNNQLRVLALALLDFDTTDISQTLNISDRTAASIVKSLKNTDLTRVLYRRKF